MERLLAGHYRAIGGKAKERAVTGGGPSGLVSTGNT